MKKTVKKKALSGWIGLNRSQVEELAKMGILIMGARKDEDGKYVAYLFKQSAYPRISHFLKGGE